MRILVVDDEQDIREIVGLFLEDAGIGYELAADLEGAKQALIDSHFDIVISDIRMPGGSGFHLLDHVRTTYPAIPVILMSGWYNDLDKAKHMRPRLPILHKPFGAANLEYSIRDAKALISADAVRSAFQTAT